MLSIMNRTLRLVLVCIAIASTTAAIVLLSVGEPQLIYGPGIPLVVSIGLLLTERRRPTDSMQLDEECGEGS